MIKFITLFILATLLTMTAVYVWRDCSDKEQLAFIKLLGLGTVCATVIALVISIVVFLF